MAENKKSFLMYCDWIHTVEKLTDKKAGELLKHLLRYVNDQNPTTTDPMVDLAFEPIKQQLKRDLKKYESKQELWSKAGKASVEARRKNSTESTYVKNVERKPTESTVNANANVTVNVNDNVSVISEYMRPRDFLKENNGIGLHELQMKSGLNGEFEHCIEQWSLSVEGSDFKYSNDKGKDTRVLLARLQKWVNTWSQKNRDKPQGKAQTIVDVNAAVKRKIDEQFSQG